MAHRSYANMYEVALDEAWELFGDHLSGGRSALLLAVSERPLGDRARTALASAAATLGYGANACAFAALEGPEGALDRQALFMLVEGLDPIGLVAADAEAARLLAEAYRCPVALDGARRVFGRTCVAFASFEGMLDDDREKQRAWGLLKRLSGRPLSP